MTYDDSTTTADVLAGVDLSGRRIAITGAASGLGEEAARALAGAGAKITMLARDGERNEAAATRIRESVPDADLTLESLDLADLASVRACATRLLDAGDPIDVLINNAGVMCCPEWRTADGFEMQFGTNHLGHFVLTNMLAPLIIAGDEARIVNLSSAGHTISDVDFDDPNFETRDYDPWVSYGQSKTANMLFTVELARRLGPAGVKAYSVHPGMIRTNLGRHMTAETLQQMMDRVKARQEASGEPGGGGAPEFKSTEAGAATEVWAATAPELAEHSGAYLADCRVATAGVDANQTGYAPYALDPDSARKLWTLSEELVGQKFDL